MVQVLLVEDDDDIREDLAELLRDEGYSVETASNGAEALAKLVGRDPPSLILLDLMMPVMDGWKFREAQRNTGCAPEVPVVVLSGVADVPGAARRLDAAAFLTKPIGFDELLSVVETHCRA